MAISKKIRASFYTIHEMGLYPYSDKHSSLTGQSDFLSQIETWVKNPALKLGDNCTFKPSKDSDDGGSKAYCYDILSDSGSGDFLLTMWNEVPSIDGKVAMLDGNSAMGNATVDSAEISDGHIPGFATYFWFIPSKNAYACIHVESMSTLENGRKNVEKYIKGFIQTICKYACTDNKGKLTGYMIDDKKIKMRTKLRSERYRKKGEIDFIVSNFANIRKLYRKTTLLDGREKSKQDDSLVQKVLEKLTGGRDYSNAQDPIQFKCELPYQPTPGDLKLLIKEWNDEQDSLLEWDDVGFKMKGNSKAYWLSSTLAAQEVEARLELANNHVVGSSSLFKELLRMRPVLLESMNEHTNYLSDLQTEGAETEGAVNEYAG